MASIRDYTFYINENREITHYKKGERGRKNAYSGAANFIAEYSQGLPELERAEFFRRIEKADYSRVVEAMVKHAQVVEYIENSHGGSALMAQNFIYIQFQNEDRTHCNVLLKINQETNTFAKMGSSNEDDLLDKLHSALYSSLNPEIADWYEALLTTGSQKGLKNHKQILQAHLNHLFKNPQFHISDVENISNDPSIPNFAYYNLEHIQALPIRPTPTWDEFTSQFDHPEKIELFQAWLYSIFDASNTGRQWMWIQGNGLEGKSQMYMAILRYMDKQFGKGRAYFAATNSSHDSNRFFFAQAEGKRLCVFGDTREIGLLRNENFLKLSGHDTAVVEAKHKAAYSVRLYSKLLLVSNVFPQVNFASRAEVSRIIMMRLIPSVVNNMVRHDAINFGNKLLSEIEYYLRKCKISYDKLRIPESHEFRLPKVVKDEMLAHCMTHQYLVEQYFVKHMLEFSPDVKTPVAILQSHLRKFAGDEFIIKSIHFNMENIRMMLEDKYNCSYVYLQTKAGLEVPYIVGCKVRDKMSKSFTDLFREEEAQDIDLTEI